jgi:hypothetical protein
MKKALLIGLASLLTACSSGPTSAPKPASQAAGSGTPAELQSLIGVRGSAGEAGMQSAGYTFRNATQTDSSSVTHWRGKDGGCVEVATKDGSYSSITAVDAAKCAEDGSAVASSAKAGAARTVCGVIVDGKTNRYICEVEENRQGTTVLRLPDTTLNLKWNLGSNSVSVAQDGMAPQVVKYSDSEGETNFRLDKRTFFYISNPGMAEMEVKNFKQQ